MLTSSPLIILGEPGAGKSVLLKFASEQLGAKTFNASTIGAGPVFDEHATIIVDGIDEITAYEEGTMPNNKRCDLLNTHGLLSLPIEIKGQWHAEVWTAAAQQLQNYTREYHSDGRGIYLVLWFGYLGPNHRKNPRGWSGQPLPKNLNDMKNLLAIKFENVSEKTKIMLLDLSKIS